MPSLSYQPSSRSSHCPKTQTKPNGLADASMRQKLAYTIASCSGLWPSQSRSSRVCLCHPNPVPSRSVSLYQVAWAGLRDAALAKASRVSDAVFVHLQRFIGGAQPCEAALSMVSKDPGWGWGSI